MPPGVSVNDIPGNRPEDLKEEAFWEAIEDKCREANLRAPGEGDEHAMLWIEMARDLAYADGFEDGKQEAIIDLAAKYADNDERNAEENAEFLDKAMRESVPRGAPGCTCGTPPFAPPEPSSDCPFHGKQAEAREASDRG